MTLDTNLIARAQAGDRAAMSELLRLCSPAVRGVVFAALRHTRTTFEVFEDAVQEGIITLWRCVPNWAPDGSANLMTFAEIPIRRAAWAAARRSGHAVTVRALETAHDGAQAIENRGARRACMMPVKSLEAPAFEDGSSLADMLEAPALDETAALDARRALSVLTEAQRALVWSVAVEGESRAALAAAAGRNRFTFKLRYDTAIARARAELCEERQAA